MDKKDWTYRKLGEVCEVQNGLWTGKKPPFVKVGVIRNTNFTKDCTLDDSDIFFTDVEEKAYKKRKLLKGDIIIEKSGGSEKQPVGRPILFDLDGEYSFSNFTSVLRLNTNELTPSFLHKALVGLYFQGKTRPLQSKTTGIHNLDFNKFLQFSIPIPLLPTQQRIVAELDCISTILEKKRQQLKELDNLAQAIFYDMFGDPVENERGWEVKEYGEEFVIGAGGTPSKSNLAYWEGGRIPWIGSNMCQNKVIYETDGKYITEEGLSHSSAKMLEEGTVLVALVGATIGKVGLLKTATSTNQNVAFIKVNQNHDFDSYFVYYQLQSLYVFFMSIGNGDFKMANQAFIKALPIIKPPLSLQQSFAAKIEAIEKQKERISQSIKEVQTLFDSRMQEYFG